MLTSGHLFLLSYSFILDLGFFILNYGLLPFLPCLPSEVYHCVSISAFFAFWILDWMGQISGEYSCLSAFLAFTAGSFMDSLEEILARFFLDLSGGKTLSWSSLPLSVTAFKASPYK